MEPRDLERKTFPLVRRGYDPQGVDTFLQDVAIEYRKVIQAAERAARTSEEAERAAAAESEAGQDLPEIGSHVGAVLAAAAKAAEDMETTAKQEAEAVRNAARQEVAGAQQEAARHLAAAKKERAEAKREAATARAAIRSEAAKMQQEAQEAAAAIEAEARKTAIGIEQAARREVGALVAAGRSKYDRLRAVQQAYLDHLSSLEAFLGEARGRIAPLPAEDAVESGMSLEEILKDPAGIPASAVGPVGGEAAVVPDASSADKRPKRAVATKRKPSTRRGAEQPADPAVVPTASDPPGV